MKREEYLSIIAELKKYRRAICAIDMAEDLIEEVKTRLENISPRVSLERERNKIYKDILPDELQKIADINLKIADMKMDSLHDMAGTIELINKISNPTQRRILTLRYIRGYTWEKIADIMNYDRSWIMRLHYKAIKELAGATGKVADPKRNNKE